MASTISAGLTSGTAIALVGDTSGALVLQTNGTTTAVTISTAQDATFAGKVTSAGALTLASNGTTTAITVDTSQNVLVGDTAAVLGSRLCVKSAGSTASTNNCIYKNSSATSLFVIRDDGYMSTGLAAGSPYNSTTASAANLFVYSADGALYRSTSSIKYKTNVKNATHGLSELLKLRPVSYEGKNEIDAGKIFGGLIAEEVHEAGLTEFVQYAEDGTPDALAYGHMVALCVKAIQELKAIIDTQTTRISALEDK